MTTTDTQTCPIVVAADPAANPWSTIRWAAVEAADRGLRLRLVHLPTLLGDVPEPDFPYATAVIRAGERFLASAVQHATFVAPEVNVSSRLVLDPRHGHLAELGRDAVLLVAGVTSDAHRQDALLGRTGQILFTHARHPVIAVPGRPYADYHSHAPVVVALSSTVDPDVAANMIAYAFDEAARRLAAAVTLVHRSGESLLTDVVQSCRTRYPGVRLRTHQTADDSPAGLLSWSHGARLFVVGCHQGEGLGGFDSLSAVRLSVTSVACPIAIIRPGIEVPQSGHRSAGTFAHRR